VIAAGKNGGAFVLAPDARPPSGVTVPFRMTERSRRDVDDTAHLPHDAGALFLALGPRVLGYLRAHGAREPEDLLGEVFLQVSRDLGRFRGDAAALRRWVFTVAHHRLVDDQRRRAVRPHTVGEEAPERPSRDPDPIDPALIAAIRTLTPLQRDVVVLRFVADLSLRDVARITHRPVSAVKSMQARGLARLRSALDEDTWRGESG